MIYVPFNASGVTTGVARMPQAIHSAGVETRLPPPVEATWIEVSGLTQERGPSGLISEGTVVSVVIATAAVLRETWSDGDVPVVVAGDCPVLLAPLVAAAVRGQAGLVFIDGHEDAWDPRVTPTGEASDCEIGLALGLYGGPKGLGRDLPCLSPEHLVVLGPRDQANWRTPASPASVNASRTIAAAPNSLPNSPTPRLPMRSQKPLRQRQLGGGATSISTCSIPRRLLPSIIHSPVA